MAWLNVDDLEYLRRAVPEATAFIQEDRMGHQDPANGYCWVDDGPAGGAYSENVVNRIPPSLRDAVEFELWT